MKNIAFCFPHITGFYDLGHQLVGCEDSILQAQLVELSRFGHVLNLTEGKLFNATLSKEKNS